MLSLPEVDLEAQRLLRDIDAEELFKDMETWISHYRGNSTSARSDSDTAATPLAFTWADHLPTFALSDTNPSAKADATDRQQHQPLATCNGLGSLGSEMQPFVPTSLAQQTTLAQAQQITPPMHAQLIIPPLSIPTDDGKTAQALASPVTGIALPFQSVAPWPSMAWRWLPAGPSGLPLSSPSPSSPSLELFPSTTTKYSDDGGQHEQRLDTVDTGAGTGVGTSADADAGAQDASADLIPGIFPSTIATLGSLVPSTSPTLPLSLLTHSTPSSSLPFPESLAFITLPDLSFISNADTTNIDANVLAMTKTPLNPYVAATSAVSRDTNMATWKPHETTIKNSRSRHPTHYAPLESSPSPWIEVASRFERKRTWDSIQDEEQREVLLQYAPTYSLPTAVPPPSIAISSSSLPLSLPLPLSTRSMATVDVLQAASQSHTHKKARIGTQNPLRGVPYRSTLPSSSTSLYDTSIASPFVTPSPSSTLPSIASQTTTMPACLASRRIPTPTRTPTPSTSTTTTPTPMIKPRSPVSPSPVKRPSTSLLQKQERKQEFYFMDPYKHSTIKVDRRSCNSRKELKMAQARARALQQSSISR